MSYLLPSSLLLCIARHGDNERATGVRILHRDHQRLMCRLLFLTLVKLKNEQAQFLKSQWKLEDGRVLQEVVLYHDVTVCLCHLHFTSLEKTFAHPHDCLLQIFGHLDSTAEDRGGILGVQGVIRHPEVVVLTGIQVVQCLVGHHLRAILDVLVLSEHAIVHILKLIGCLEQTGDRVRHIKC